MDHAYIEEHNLIERYALGRLNTEQQMAFEEHFATCPDCLEGVEVVQDMDSALRSVAAEDGARANAAEIQPAPTPTHAIGAIATGEMPDGLAAAVAAAPAGSGVGAGLLGLALEGSIENLTPVTNEDLVDPSPDDWLMLRGNYEAWSYSELDDINRDNVDELRMEWAWALTEGGRNQPAPIAHDGILYIVNMGNMVQALDGATGELLWEHYLGPSQVIARAMRGVATGLVVVGDLIGEGAAREETVVGDTPNLAARLQGLAEPGRIVVAEGTRQLLGGLFDLEDLGRHTVKGLDEPVPAYAVLGERTLESRFAARGSSVMSEIVGRDQELALLLGALGTSVRRRRPDGPADRRGRYRQITYHRGDVRRTA